MEQPMPTATEPSWPLDPSLPTSPLKSPPHFYLILVPALSQRTLLLLHPAQHSPSQTFPNVLTMGFERGLWGPLLHCLSGGPAASPGTQTPGSRGELRPVLAAGEAQPVIGMSHPLARQPWGGGRKGKRGREAREERKGGGAGGKPQAASGVGLSPGVCPPCPQGHPL